MTTEDILWTPGPDALVESGVARYLRWLSDRRGLDFGSYRELWQWSVIEHEAFWQSVWDFEEIGAAQQPGAVLADASMPGASWFPGARLNYAQHLLRHLPATGDEPALIAVGEDGPAVPIGAQALRQQAGGLAAHLRELGVRPGDRVVAYLPNTVHAVVGLIACASIGAVWSVCAPDLGSGGVIGRFDQLEPTVVIAATGYRHAGRVHRRDRELAEIAAALPTVRQVIAVDLLDPAAPPPADLAVAASSWQEATAATTPLTFEQVPFDHPLWVLFSSGTTGRPKGIVHGHGGILLEHLKVLRMHNDVRPGDRFLLVANTSWMVWNVLVSGMLTGGIPVLLDGSPTQPDLDRVWRVAAEQRVGVLGVGAGYLQACRAAGLRPRDRHDLGGLRALTSTGSPLPGSGFGWVHDAVGSHVWLSSTSGGTDVCSSFVGGTPIQPVRAGRIQGPCLGVDVQAWDAGGRQLTGSPGELVVTRPMPSMPLRLWGDPDGKRYRDTYFATYPGVWRHGDVIEFDVDGSCVIHGRSDSTLNRKGVRIGPAEVYGVVETVPGVREALIVGVELGEDYRLPLFVEFADGADQEEVRAGIVAAIRRQLSPRHLPDEIVSVPGIPHTRTGKKLEIPVKRLLQGVPLAQVADPSGVDDPALLDFYARYAERKR